MVLRDIGIGILSYIIYYYYTISGIGILSIDFKFVFINLSYGCRNCVAITVIHNSPVKFLCIFPVDCYRDIFKSKGHIFGTRTEHNIIIKRICTCFAVVYVGEIIRDI